MTRGGRQHADLSFVPKRLVAVRLLVKLQISVRTVIILLLALAAGVITTVLLWTTAVPMVQAMLSGIASSAGTFQFLDKIINIAQ